MFDYFYVNDLPKFFNEAEQSSFLYMPKFFLTDKPFTDLSNGAKLLYTLMLHRMSLSVKNGWVDEENHEYIIYAQEQVQLDMNCGHDKCTKMFNELEDIGLIYRKRRGLGMSDLIYVKNFVHDLED